MIKSVWFKLRNVENENNYVDLGNKNELSIAFSLTKGSKIYIISTIFHLNLLALII